MKTLALLFFIFHTTLVSAASLPAYSTQYNPQRDAFADGKHASELAAKTQRKVLIEVGGDWCAWCHKLDRFLHSNPDIQQQLHSTFVLLKINVSEANDNAAFLKIFPPALGYPHMYITNGAGKILWSQDTAEFLHKGNYSREQLLKFIQKWKNHEPSL